MGGQFPVTHRVVAVAENVDADLGRPQRLDVGLGRVRLVEGGVQQLLDAFE